LFESETNREQQFEKCTGNKNNIGSIIGIMSSSHNKHDNNRNSKGKGKGKSKQETVPQPQDTPKRNYKHSKQRAKHMKLDDDSEESLMKMLLFLEDEATNNQYCEEGCRISRQLDAIDLSSVDNMQRVNKMIRDERYFSRQQQLVKDKEKQKQKDIKRQRWEAANTVDEPSESLASEVDDTPEAPAAGEHKISPKVRLEVVLRSKTEEAIYSSSNASAAYCDPMPQLKRGPPGSDPIKLKKVVIVDRVTSDYWSTLKMVQNKLNCKSNKVRLLHRRSKSIIDEYNYAEFMKAALDGDVLELVKGSYKQLDRQKQHKRELKQKRASESSVSLAEDNMEDVDEQQDKEEAEESCARESFDGKEDPTSHDSSYEVVTSSRTDTYDLCMTARTNDDDGGDLVAVQARNESNRSCTRNSAKVTPLNEARVHNGVGDDESESSASDDDSSESSSDSDSDSDSSTVSSGEMIDADIDVSDEDSYAETRLLSGMTNDATNYGTLSSELRYTLCIHWLSAHRPQLVPSEDCNC
jgi:hypothetical protein